MNTVKVIVGLDEAGNPVTRPGIVVAEDKDEDGNVVTRDVAVLSATHYGVCEGEGEGMILTSQAGVQTDESHSGTLSQVNEQGQKVPVEPGTGELSDWPGQGTPDRGSTANKEGSMFQDPGAGTEATPTPPGVTPGENYPPAANASP